MTSGKPIVIAVAADVAEFRSDVSKVESDLKGVGTTAQQSGAKVDAAFSSTAESADNVASKGSQAAGALSGLGGLAAMAGGNVGAMGTAMTVAGVGVQGLADAGDLLNVVTESTIVKTALSKASTVANTVVTVAQTVATTALTGATTALGVAIAIATSPIGIIVIAIAALTAGVILAYKHSQTFRDIVNGVFSAVAAYVKTYVAVVKTALDLFGRGLDGVTGAAVAVEHGVEGAIDGSWNKISALPGRIKNLGGDMLTAGKNLVSNLVDGVQGVGTDIAKEIAHAINDVLHLPLKLPGFSIAGKHFGGETLIPAIPLANGGITNGPTVALIGDNPGGKEAVVPLDKYALGGSTNHYHINVQVPVGASLVEAGRAVVQAIAAYERAGGRRPVTA